MDKSLKPHAKYAESTYMKISTELLTAEPVVAR